jgi:hypothetical protein
MDIGNLLVKEQAIERPEGRHLAKRRKILRVGAAIANGAHPGIVRCERAFPAATRPEHTQRIG